MMSPDNKTVRILCNRYWQAGIHYGDYIQDFRFEESGRGEFTFGYGHAVRLQFSFMYRVLGGRRIEFTADTDRPLLGGPRIATFRIEKGPFKIANSFLLRRYKAFVFKYRLTLEPDPYQDDYGPFERDMPYYANRFEIKLPARRRGLDGKIRRVKR